MKKSKKRISKIIIISGVIISTTITTHKIFATTTEISESRLEIVKNKENDDYKQGIFSTNPTIQGVVSMLKDKSQEEIDEYFNILGEDRQKIIATGSEGEGNGVGIAASSDPDFIGVVGIITDEKGNTKNLDLNSPDAATIGEIKEVLNKVKK